MYIHIYSEGHILFFLSYFSVFLKTDFVVDVELVAGNNCTRPMPLARSMRCSDPWSLGPSYVFGMSAHLALDMFLTSFRKLEMVIRVSVSCHPLNKKIVRLPCDDLAAEVYWVLAGCCQTHKLHWKQSSLW